MDPKHPTPPPRAEETSAWHALVDGQLTPAQAQALSEQLRDDEEAQATLAHWQTQRQRLQAGAGGHSPQGLPAVGRIANRNEDAPHKAGRLR